MAVVVFAVLAVVYRLFFLWRAVKMTAIVVSHTDHEKPSMMVKLARGETVVLLAPGMDALPIGTELTVVAPREDATEAQLPDWQSTWYTPGAFALVGVVFMLWGWLSDALSE